MNEHLLKREAWIWHDGQLIQWKNANTHLLTHAFQYGAGLVFEGERAYKVGNRAVIFRSGDHSRRLIESAKAVGLPINLTMDRIEEAKYAVLKKNNYDEAYVRAFIWRSGAPAGNKMMGVNPAGAKLHFAVAAWPDWTEVGVPRNTIISQWRRAAPNSFPPQAKANAYGTSELALLEATANPGINDAVVLDYEGYVAEGATANLTFLKDGELYTPKSDRFLSGITNDTLKAIAHAEGYKIHDQDRITVDELIAAEEIMFSGTAIEIAGVESIDGKFFGTDQITQLFQENYRDLVHSDEKTVQKLLKDYRDQYTRTDPGIVLVRS